MSARTLVLAAWMVVIPGIADVADGGLTIEAVQSDVFRTMNETLGRGQLGQKRLDVDWLSQHDEGVA